MIGSFDTGILDNSDDRSVVDTNLVYASGPLVAQDRPTNVPEDATDDEVQGLPDGETYGQSFTVEQGFSEITCLSTT